MIYILNKVYVGVFRYQNEHFLKTTAFFFLLKNNFFCYRNCCRRKTSYCRNRLLATWTASLMLLWCFSDVTVMIQKQSVYGIILYKKFFNFWDQNSENRSLISVNSDVFKKIAVERVCIWICCPADSYLVLCFKQHWLNCHLVIDLVLCCVKTYTTKNFFDQTWSTQIFNNQFFCFI